jgi:DnaJ-class molecular chaperone
MSNEVFAVVCKDDDGVYLLATSRAFSFEEAHAYVQTVASSRHACVIPAGMAKDLRSSTGNALKVCVDCQGTGLCRERDRTGMAVYDDCWTCKGSGRAEVCHESSPND